MISKAEFEEIGRKIIKASYEVHKKLGYLINFNVPLIKQGIKRKVNNYFLTN